MSDDIRDPIIDSLLDELLGDVQAPDLTQRILSEQATRDAQGEKVQRQDRIAIAGVDRPRVSAAPLRKKKRPSARADWRGWSTVAVVLMIASVLGILVVRQRGEPPFVGRDLSELTDETPAPPKPAPSPPSAPIGDGTENGPPAFAEQPDPSSKLAANSTDPAAQPRAPHGLQRPSPAQLLSSDENIVGDLNRRLTAKWKDAGLQVPAGVGSEQWCRRAYATLIGRDPTQQELYNFSGNKNKRQLAEALCASDEFSTHWGGKLARILVGTHHLPNGADRVELARHLSGALRDKRGYDELVYELMTAEGSTNPDQEDYNPATNFLLALGVDAQDRSNAANQLCRLFLGKQVGCAQCHQHPIDQQVGQAQFWQFAAFLTQIAVERQDGTRLFDRDFPGSQGTPDEAELFFQVSDGTVEVAYPAFFNDVASTRSGLLTDIVRRDELANKIVNSPDFSRAFVNRMWSQIYGSGFTQPVDDMGPHNPPSHPEMLERLAAEFRASEFNTRDLVRWMVLSTAFDRQPVQGGDLIATDDHLFLDFESPGSPRPQLGSAIRQLADARRRGESFDGVLLGNMGSNNPENPERTKSTAATPRLRKLTPSTEAMLRRLAASEKITNAQRVEHLFMALLARRPFEHELSEAVAILDAEQASLPALRDLAQTVVNSDECASEH